MIDLKILTANDGEGGGDVLLHVFSVAGDVLHPIPDSCLNDGVLRIDNFGNATDDDINAAFRAKYGPWSDALAFYPHYRLVDPSLPYAGHYPRVWRPTYINTQGREKSGVSFPSNQWGAHFANHIHNANLRSQISRFIRQLLTISESIHFTEENLSVYGLALRDLLIAIATEIELVFRGILRENGYQHKEESRWNTGDFIKLRDLMRLDHYMADFPGFPTLKFSCHPFEAWDEKRPTKSLRFYDAYNLVKHDREKHFHEASLKNVLEAIAALLVLARAQMGKEALYGFDPLIGQITDTPTDIGWKPEEVYIPAVERRGWLNPIEWFASSSASQKLPIKA